VATDSSHTGTKQSPLDEHHFLLRRLHSLTGIVPIGIFLIAHLTTNSTIVWGAINKRAESGVEFSPDEQTFVRQIATFWHEVMFINELPFLIAIEIALWLSIAFHAGLGFVYAFTGRGNTGRYKYSSNWRYSLQRWSGYIGIFFIFYHVATLRWQWTWLVPGGVEWDHYYAASKTAAVLQGTAFDEPTGITIAGIFVSLFYMLGVTMLVFHFANGLWTAAITWGLTITETAQKRWGYVCAALGAGLMAAGWASVIGFLMVDVEQAKAIETQLLEDKNADLIKADDDESVTVELVEQDGTGRDAANENTANEGGN
jgi:succinate dehydrogenase / fumarate reductase cytochrome b subunit